MLTPKSGPKVKFVIETLIPDREFVDVSLLPGARLTFRHLITTRPAGGSTIDVTVTMDGPLRWPWARILGNGFRASAQPDLNRLVQAAQAPR